MRVVHHRIDFTSRGERIRIIPLGDIHAGHRNCDEKLLDETIAEIAADDHCYWGGMGDYCECIWRTDKRHRESNYAPWLWGRDRVLAAQREWVAEKLAPIGDKCLWFLIGNHELYALDKLGVDMYYELMRAIVGEERCAQVMLGIHGYCRISFGLPTPTSRAMSRVYYIYAHHGFGGGDLAGGKALRMERVTQRYRADLYLMGHSHDRLVLPRTQIECSPRSLAVETKTVFGVYTGSFLRTIDSPKPGDLDSLGMYAEEKGYHALPVGSPMVEICGSTGHTSVRV